MEMVFQPCTEQPYTWVEDRDTYIIEYVDQITGNHYSNGVKVETLHLGSLGDINILPGAQDWWLQIPIKSQRT
jgi:hypothetical protein